MLTQQQHKDKNGQSKQNWSPAVLPPAGFLAGVGRFNVGIAFPPLPLHHLLPHCLPARSEGPAQK